MLAIAVEAFYLDWASGTQEKLHVRGRRGEAPCGLIVDALAQLRAEEGFRDTPVIMLTVESQRSSVAAAAQHQASEYLVKPVVLRELENWLRNYRKGDDS